MTDTMAYILIILLLPFGGLDGAEVFCPTGCRCTWEVLNCSRLANSPGLRRVPLPKRGVHYPFQYLDFAGNSISFVGKKVWKAYPWAKYLNLRGNRLTCLQTWSLEDLTFVTHLDLSYNNIRSIGKKTFEAVPFLQLANLSGNMIERIPNETFKTWHGMQFLSILDLSHNPLAVIQDTCLYKLPLLKFLDLGATKMKPKIFGDLLETSLPLKTVIVPRRMTFAFAK